MNITTPDLRVETVLVETLQPDPDNARVHGRDNIAAIKASLERFGQARPLLVAKDGTVLAGNGTLAAIRSLGWVEVQVIRLPWEDRDRCRAYAIADNRTAELAAWDNDLLGDQVRELTAAGLPMMDLGFDLSGAGGHAPAADDLAAGRDEAARAYRCPACGFRWRYDDGGEVVPL